MDVLDFSMIKLSRKSIIIIGALFLLLLLLPLTIFFIQKRSEIRSNAAASCGNVAIDALVIIDVSSSMNASIGGSAITKIAGAKEAAKKFVNILASNTENRVSLISFSQTANVDQSFTTDYASILSKIDALKTSSNTCHECAILAANAEIAAHRRADKKNAVILLTDGRANHIYGNSDRVDVSLAEQKALEAAIAGKTANDTIFYTIGLGDNIYPDFLKQLAESTGGSFYFSPTTNDLNTIYNTISQILGKGSVSGIVFNDANENASYETGEAKLPGWTIKLSSSTDNISTITDNTGAYSFTGLCDGLYTVEETQQQGWTQTLPPASSGYPLTVTNGTIFTDKNFGNAQIIPTATPTNTPVPTATLTPTATPTSSPTPTATPNPTATPTPTTIPDTSFSITMFLHGIGNSGDNTNPSAHSLSNKNPVHPERPAIITLYDINNNLAGTGSGTIKYSSTSGNFVGTITTDQPVLPGKYLIKVGTEYHLIRQLPGIQTVISNATTTLPSSSMVAGDVNSDNTLNILDYNLIIDCYSDLAPAVSCNEEKKLTTDINDDNAVNQFDYNLFLREIATQPGE